jgi:hypothetical protein
MKNPKTLARLEHTAVRGKWFEVNKRNLAMNPKNYNFKMDWVTNLK